MSNDKPADASEPLSAAYVGPIEPETPSLKDPREILREIGVKRYLSPHSPKWESTEIWSPNAD
jgi:hypothetical protein